jgi:hypothetical protein
MGATPVGRSVVADRWSQDHDTMEVCLVRDRAEARRGFE